MLMKVEPWCLARLRKVIVRQCVQHQVCALMGFILGFGISTTRSIFSRLQNETSKSEKTLLSSAKSLGGVLLSPCFTKARGK